MICSLIDRRRSRVTSTLLLMLNAPIANHDVIYHPFVYRMVTVGQYGYIMYVCMVMILRDVVI